MKRAISIMTVIVMILTVVVMMMTVMVMVMTVIVMILTVVVMIMTVIVMIMTDGDDDKDGNERKEGGDDDGESRDRDGDDNPIKSISLSSQKKCSCITPCGTHTVGLLGCARFLLREGIKKNRFF